MDLSLCATHRPALQKRDDLENPASTSQAGEIEMANVGQEGDLQEIVVSTSPSDLIAPIDEKANQHSKKTTAKNKKDQRRM